MMFPVAGTIVPMKGMQILIPYGDKFLIQVLLFRPPLAPPNLGGEINSSPLKLGGEIVLPLSSCLASVLRPSEGELEGV